MQANGIAARLFHTHTKYFVPKMLLTDLMGVIYLSSSIEHKCIGKDTKINHNFEIYVTVVIYHDTTTHTTTVLYENENKNSIFLLSCAKYFAFFSS